MKHFIISAFAAALTLGCSSGSDTVNKRLNTSIYTPLIGHEWVIEDIAGRGVIDMSYASLVFLEEGRLAGNATCNRILGNYKISDRRIDIDSAGTTMMSCPEALMRQERVLLEMLPRVQSYRIDATNALILETRDGQRIVARRR